MRWSTRGRHARPWAGHPRLKAEQHCRDNPRRCSSSPGHDGSGVWFSPPLESLRPHWYAGAGGGHGETDGIRDRGIVRGRQRHCLGARPQRVRCGGVGDARGKRRGHRDQARRIGSADRRGRARSAFAGEHRACGRRGSLRLRPSRPPGQQCRGQRAQARGRCHRGRMGRRDGDQPEGHVLPQPAVRPPFDRRRPAGLDRQHRVDAWAGRRGRALDLRHIQGGDHPHDQDAGDRMGGAPHPRQRDRARTDGYAVAVARRNRSEIHGGDAQAHPAAPLATVDEVAAAVCYLASPLAASITGHTIVLDGGLTVV
jgi:Enoyl-(Acyl carrier protein) reductase